MKAEASDPSSGSPDGVEGNGSCAVQAHVPPTSWSPPESGTLLQVPFGAGGDSETRNQLKTMTEIDMWCEKGIPNEQILARIRERSDRDCSVAMIWLSEWLQSCGSPETLLQISEMADNLRSTPVVFSFFESGFQEHFKAAPENAVSALRELIALTVEAYVRAADKCFPRNLN